MADGHQAACVTTLFDRLKEADLGPLRKLEVESDLFKLTFPYEGQAPYDGADSGCTAKVEAITGAVKLSVKPHACGLGSQCAAMLAEYLTNRATVPWSATRGVPADAYLQQRELVADWDACVCSGAGPAFASTGCTCATTPVVADVNGGVCRCRATSGPQAPSCTECAPLRIAGNLTVLNGPEDLFIQYTYGKALVEGYQAVLGADRARLVTYDGADGAGHGVLMQHPKWIQEQIAAALKGA